MAVALNGAIYCVAAEPEAVSTSDGQGNVSESAQNDGTDVGSAETATEQPKKRTRKSRKVTEAVNGVVDPVNFEEAKADVADPPKRKRRRKANTVTEADMNTDHTIDITDDELPF